MLKKGMYISVFHYLCYEMDISTDRSEDQLLEERDPDLNEQEDIRLDEIREERCMDVAQEGHDKKNFCALRQEV